MLLGPTKCSNQAIYLRVLCLISFLSVPAFSTTLEPIRKLLKKTTKTSGKGKPTHKPWVAPPQRTDGGKQRVKKQKPLPEEYYEDAADMVDEYAEFFPMSPYEGIDYREQLMKHSIVPDFIPAVPIHMMEIYYQNAVVKYGNTLSYNETKFEPKTIKWHHEPEKHYTLIMTDPDGPFGDARNHEEEWHHWLVTNIYGHHIGIGDVYAKYIGIIPSRGKHIHRYVFLAYEQPGNDTIDFDEIHLGSEPIDMLRGYFSAKEFAKKYNLTGPVACNFFLGDWSKAPRLKPTTQKPYTTINPEDAPDQSCHIGENIDDVIRDHGKHYNHDYQHIIRQFPDLDL